MREYLGRYKGHILIVSLFVFLIHSSKLNSVIIGIDTENLIHQKGELYGGWLNTGRQGLVLLKYLTGSVSFNPYFAGVMTLVFLTVCTVSYLLLWDKVAGGNNRLAWAGCALLWIAHPVLVEQFYFSLQSAEICMAMLFVALALWLVYEAGKRRKMLMLLFSGMLLLLAFSIYQIFVVMFIFGTVTLLLLQSLGGERREGGVVYVLRQIRPYLGVFLAAFLCNSVITKLFFSESDYLSSQVKWGNISLRDCIYNIAIHVRDVLTGQHSIFYSGFFGVLFLFGLVLVFFLVGRYGLRLLFYYLSLMTTPFLMTVVCGDVPAVRSQLILPVLTGFLVYLDAALLVRVFALGEGEAQRESSAGQSRDVSEISTEKSQEASEASTGKSQEVAETSAGKGTKRGGVQGRLQMTLAAILLVLCVACGVTEAQMSLRLYYTDACRYAQDEALGRELIRELEPLIGEDDTPVIVLGSRSFQGNNACVQGEIIGRSIFEHDVEEEPRFYWSTRRVTGFLHTLGYDCEQLPDKNIPYAMEFAEDMGVWPGKHSVEHAGDMVVIKLSEF